MRRSAALKEYASSEGQLQPDGVLEEGAEGQGEENEFFDSGDANDEECVFYGSEAPLNSI